MFEVIQERLAELRNRVLRHGNHTKYADKTLAKLPTDAEMCVMEAVAYVAGGLLERMIACGQPAAPASAP